jgi:phosphonate ABC transporter permease subunit PhnE
MKSSTSLWKSIRLGLMVLIGLLVYAYGFQVVKVDLEEFRRETRQDSRIRVTRALAQPDIIEFEQEEFFYFTQIYVPCPENQVSLEQQDTSGPHLVFSPACNDPGEEIQIEGYNFEPRSEGPLSFIPSSDPNHEIALQLKRVEVDNDGTFSVTVEMPERPSEDVQLIRVTTRKNIGAPRFTETAKETWEKIIETVFLALLATTIGTALAIPISFIAARNIMKDVQSPLSSIGLSILGWPLGIALGLIAMQGVDRLSDALTADIMVNVGGLVVSPIFIWVLIRWALPPAESAEVSRVVRTLRGLALGAGAILFLLGLELAASFAMYAGDQLQDVLSTSFVFLGNFIFQVGDLLTIIIPVLAAFAGGAIISNFSGRVGQILSERFPENLGRTANLILAPVAGAAIFVFGGAVIDWLYEVKNPIITLWGPGATGVVLGLLLAIRSNPKEALPIGNSIYYLTRTVLNAIRSVEPLIMAIVAVIWVGIGPFAGVIALAVHTIAALGKLYSEQVESIMPGPIEAITATGANRLQMIVYAVIPQIIPPYISFTMYRWDINVRMSTIIGFAGGGGIGFLLQQNINLLNYRAASAQMLAIAIVVATMDYVSSALRERFV